jgi:hypothetical protein
MAYIENWAEVVTDCRATLPAKSRLLVVSSYIKVHFDEKDGEVLNSVSSLVA